MHWCSVKYILQSQQVQFFKWIQGTSVFKELEQILVKCGANSVNLCSQPLNALVIHTAASHKTPSIWPPVGNHVSCYINVFHPLITSNPGRETKRLYSLLKILENGIFFVISAALKINNGSGVSINAPKDNLSPWKKFMVGANVLQMIWTRHVVGPLTDCVRSPHSSHNTIYLFQTF